MASNQNRRRYRLSLFRLFHRSGPARLKYSGSSRRLKNKEQVKEAQTDEGPSCSHDQRKRKSWRVRVGEVGKLLVYPLKSLRKSFSGSSKRAQQSPKNMTVYQTPVSVILELEPIIQICISDLGVQELRVVDSCQ